jgi:hypothetical protein
MGIHDNLLKLKVIEQYRDNVGKGENHETTYSMLYNEKDTSATAHFPGLRQSDA